MRLPHAAVVLLALSAGGWTAYSTYERAQLSPFALWTVRAGMPFREMDDLANREMKHRFACRSANDGFRVCELKTDGPPGVMRVAVDEGGRAIYVQFLTGDTTLMMREESRRLGADWDLVQRRVAKAGADAGAPATSRWETADHRWSAEMRAGESALLPSSITVADERAFDRLIERSVPALLLLARHGVVSDAALEAAERRAPGALVRAADSLTAGGRALAAAAATLPLCDGVPVAPAFRSSSATDAAPLPLDPRTVERNAVAEQTIARAYPGARLVVVGDRDTYMLDSTTGRWEKIRIEPSAVSENGNRFAFAVSFPDRTNAVEERALARDTTGRCRAPAEILVADVDPTTRAIAGVQRVDVDADALAARVAALEFVTNEDSGAALMTGYLATYGVAAWQGQVRWHELVAGDTLAVVRRVPEGGARGDERPGLTTALFMPGGSRDDPFGFSDEPGTVRRMMVLDLDDPYPELTAPKRLVLPSGPGGLPSGWTLLDLL